MKKSDFNAEALFAKALEDGRNRNYKAAVLKLKKLTASTDRLPQAMLYLGRAYHELGLFHEAIVSFRLFITRAPRSSAGYFYLGRTYISISKFSRAASCFNESLLLKPDFAPALAYYGYARMRCGSYSEAVDLLGRAVELDPENGGIYNMYVNCILLSALSDFRAERFEAALEGLQFLEKAGYSTLTTILYTGIILKELCRWQAAASYMERAAEMTPDDVLVKNILAELYIRQSRIEEAMQLLQTYKSDDEIREYLDGVDDSDSSIAIAFWNKQNYRAALHYALASLRKKRTATMHLLAGECLKEDGRIDEAFNHYSRAHDIDRNAVEPLYGRSVIYWVRKDYESMLAEVDRIIRLSPEDEFGLYYSVLCSSRLGHPFTEWKARLDSIPEREKDPWLLFAEAAGESSEEHDRKALSLYRKALKLDDGINEIWDNLIELQIKLEDKRGLPATLKKYLDKFSTDNERRNIYIDILVEQENFAAAAEQYRILAAVAEPDRAIISRYAYCCRKAGKYRDASILYRQLLKTDPFNENCLKVLLYCMRKDGREKDTIPLMKEAVEAFKKPSLELMLVYGTALYRNKNVEEALNIFQKCIYDGYSDWRIFRNMSVIYRERGLADWAEMYERKAEKIRT